MTVPIDSLCARPATLSPAQAATVGVPFLTAWLCLRTVTGRNSKKTVAVFGAKGAVGSAALQIARNRRAYTIAVQRGERDNPRAHAVVVSDDMAPAELAAAIRAAMQDGEPKVGVHLAVDTVGGALFDAGLAALRTGGELVTITAQGDGFVRLDLRDFYHERLTLRGEDSLKVGVVEAAAVLRELAPGFESGAFAPQSGIETVSLADAPAAYRRLADAQKAGSGSPAKVVIVP